MLQRLQPNVLQCACWQQHQKLSVALDHLGHLNLMKHHDNLELFVRIIFVILADQIVAKCCLLHRSDHPGSAFVCMA